MRVKLSSMPDPKDVSSIVLSNLYGGLNLRDDPVNVPKSQSPDLTNMWYQDGVLRKRNGLTEVFSGTDSSKHDERIWFYDKLFNGLVVYVDGSNIRYFDPSSSDPVRKTVNGAKIPDGAVHGTFFPFDEHLYYKARGTYIRLAYKDGSLTAENLLYSNTYLGYQISESVYTPIIAINRNPDGTGGDNYQPENRINPKKIVWFDIDKTSYDYYLPVHGCRVNKIRLGDQEIETTNASRKFSLGGREIEIYDEDIPDTSADYTRIHFSVPLYINENQWNTQPWIGSTSAGWNYIPNIVYSNFSVPAGSDTTYPDGVMLHPADGDTVPPEYSTNILNRALSICPYSDKSKVFVLDNGQWCNVFILAPGFTMTKYDSSSTEMWMKGYFRVSYEYAKDQWTTYDYSGKENTGWHYAKNVVYSTTDVYCQGTKIISVGGPTGSYTTFIDSFQSLALKRSGLTGSDTYKLLWISKNDEIVVFHYLVGSNQFVVTNYDSDQQWFQGKGIRKVTIHRADINKIDVEDMDEAGPYGFYVRNIVWSSVDIQWNRYSPGQTILPQTGTLSEEYRRIAEIALYRAKRDYPNANITGNYAVAASGKYVTVYIDCSMEIKSYNTQTGEFTASNFISEIYSKSDITDGLGLDFSTPASMSNQLRVTYTKDNKEAMKAIADCRFSTSYGGTDAVCVVLAGCDNQPNAIFWSGNGSYGVDATYFPMDQYNLCGTYQDPITGFGKQQSSLVVFQTQHTTRASYGITEINGRKNIDLTMTTINAERGCDRPWSIGLCGNNLVWMNSRYGVMYLKDTSAAYENMMVNISDNVDGSHRRPGLLAAIQSNCSANCIGVEDGQRYYAFTGGEMYAWDYTLSSVGDGIHGLSWTRHDGLDRETLDIQAAVDASPYGVYVGTSTGRILHLDKNATTDLGAKIPCAYTTPLLDFGGYYRLRNVNRIIMSLRTENGGSFTAEYGGESLKTTQEIRLRDNDMPWPVVLKPRGLHLNNFQLRLSSSGDDGGLEIMDTTILYTSQGKTK